MELSFVAILSLASGVDGQAARPSSVPAEMAGNSRCNRCPSKSGWSPTARAKGRRSAKPHALSRNSKIDEYQKRKGDFSCETSPFSSPISRRSGSATGPRHRHPGILRDLRTRAGFPVLYPLSHPSQKLAELVAPYRLKELTGEGNARKAFSTDLPMSAIWTIGYCPGGKITSCIRLDRSRWKCG